MEKITALFTLLPAPLRALPVHAATSKCTSNGVEVPCPAFVENIGIFAVILFGIFFIIFVIALIFWIKMLIHAIKNPIEHKPLWIIIILLGQFLGAVIYYFAVKKSFSPGTQSPAPVQAQQPPQSSSHT